MAQRVQIILELKGVEDVDKTIARLNTNLGNIGATAFKAQTVSVNQFSDALKNAITVSDQLVRTGYRVTLGISVPLIAAIGYAVKLGGELQQARISFEILTGSVANATEHIKELAEFAIKTPFNFTQVIGLSRQLQAAGIAAKEVIPLLSAVGNAIAVTGGGNDVLDRIVNQLVHIQTLGRVTLRELNPIARAGIPIFLELAEAIKRPGEAADETGRRLRVLLKTGNLPGSEFNRFFQAAQNQRYPSGLEKVSQTINTQVSNLVDALRYAGATIGEALAPAISFVLNILTPLVLKFKDFGTYLGTFPESVRIAIGVFLALGAAIGPVILVVGYFARSITSILELGAKFKAFIALLNGVTQNNIATKEMAVADNAATAAKVKETEASTVLTAAIEAETLAKQANAAAGLEQLAFFNKAPRARDAAGHFIKEEKFTQGLPSQLGLPFDTSASGFFAVGKGASDDAIAAKAAVKGVAAETGVLAGEAVAAETGFAALLTTAGEILIPILAIVSAALLIKPAIEGAVAIAKELYNWNKKNADVGVTLYADNQHPEEVAKRKADIEFKAAKQALLDKIKLNEAEQARIKLEQFALEADRSAAEFRDEAQGRELGGLQKINYELQKYITAHYTRIEKLPGEETYQEIHFAPSYTAQLDIAKGFFAQLLQESQKSQKALVEEAFKADDAINKNKLTRLDDYTKVRVAQLDSLARVEIISTDQASRQSTEIEIAALHTRGDQERKAIEDKRVRDTAVIQEDINKLSTANVDAAKTAFAISPKDASIRAGLVTEIVRNNNAELDRLRAKQQIAQRVASDETLTLTYTEQKSIYDAKVKRVDAENVLNKELHDKQIAYAQDAVLKSLNFQREDLAQRQEIALKQLEFQQPVSLQQTIAHEQAVLAVRIDYIRRGGEVEKQELAAQATEAVRQRESILAATVEDLVKRDADINALRAAGEQDQVQAAKKVNDAVAKANIDSQLTQLQLVRQNALSIYDTIKHGSDTMLDQILSKSKTVFGAIKDAVKSAFLTVFKEIVSSQIASGLSYLTTGQKITYQSAANASGPFGGIGNILSRLGLGRPIVGNPNPEVPGIGPGGTNAVAEAAVTAVLNRQRASIVAGEPAKLLARAVPIPPEGAAGSTLEFLKTQFASGSSIGDVRLDTNGAVPTVIKNLAELAATHPTKKGLPTGVDQDDTDFINLLAKETAQENIESVYKGVLKALREINGSNNAGTGALISPSGIIKALTHQGPSTFTSAPSSVPILPLPLIPNVQSIFTPGLPSLDTIQKFNTPQAQVPGFLGTNSIAADAFLKLQTPDAVSRFTKTPIYFTPDKSTGLLGDYNEAEDIIKIYTDRANTAARLHEEAHAAITKLGGNDYASLNELLSFNTIAKGTNTLNTFFKYGQADRLKEFIPRLLAGQGQTLGLSQPQANTQVDSLISGLRSQNKNGLADAFSGIFGASSSVPYTEQLYGYATSALPTSNVGVAQGQAPVTNAVTSFDLSKIIPGIFAGASGGIAAGAVVGALAGIPGYFTDRIKQVQDQVKDIYKLSIDRPMAKSLLDIIDKEFRGSISLGIRSAKIREILRLYQQVRGHGGQSGFSAFLGRFGSAALPAFGAAGLGLLSNLTSGGGAGDIGTSGTAAAGASSGGGWLSNILNPANSGGSNSPFSFEGGTSNYSATGGSPFSITTANGSSYNPFGVGSPSVDVGPSLDYSAPPGLGTGASVLSNLGTAIQGSVAGKGGSTFGGLLSKAAVTNLGKFFGIGGATSGTGGPGSTNPFKTGTSFSSILSSPAAGAIGASLFFSSFKNTNRVGSSLSAAGGGLLAGAAAASSLGLTTTAGAELGLGVGLFANGVQRGGVLGLAETVGGGALAGYRIAGPIGAAVGAAVGAVVGGLRLAGVISTKAEQLQKAVKDTFHITISNLFARSLLKIIDQTYGGSISIGIRSLQIRQLLELYAQSTGQNARGIVQHDVASNFANVNGRLTQLPSYFNGSQVYPGQLNTNIGLPTEVNGFFGTAGASGANTVPNSTRTPQALHVQLDGPATTALLQGQAVATIASSPRLISSASLQGQNAGAGRRETASALINPAFTVS